MSSLRVFLALTVVLALARLAAGQEQEPRLLVLEVHVTASSGALVELDLGREEGVEPGDRVVLYPVGRPQVEGLVRSVTAHGARAELAGGATQVEPGTRGEVRVPAGRTDGGAAPAWEHPAEEFDPERPLLSETYARGAAERERTFSGRVFQQLDWTTDDAGESSEHALARTGLDLRGSNPFGRGGELELDLELWHRRFEDGADASQDEETTRLRLDRLSYAFGGGRASARRWEAGRFLQNEFPELGVLDGVEITQRLESGDRVGASVGLMPELDADFETGDDVQAAVYYRHVAGPEEELALGVAYQKTWHEGDADRDLLVGTFDLRPSRSLSLWSTARVDYYGSEDEAKDSGFELTDLHAGVTWSSPRGDGLSLSGSLIRWPELLRREFTPLTEEQLADRELERVGVSGWKRLSDAVRLTARVDRWSDDEDSGGGGEVGVALRDVLWQQGELRLSAFTNTGVFSDADGVRAGASGRAPRGWWNLSWEAARFDQEGFEGEQAELLQHRVRASWDTGLGRDWDLSVYGEQRLGDEQDSTTLGFYLSRGF